MELSRFQPGTHGSVGDAVVNAGCNVSSGSSEAAAAHDGHKDSTWNQELGFSCTSQGPGLKKKILYTESSEALHRLPREVVQTPEVREWGSEH